jgi:hypothetical protein
MVRNPKDVVTSFYRLMQWGDQLVDGDKSFDQFIDAFVEGKGITAYTKLIFGLYRIYFSSIVL